MPGTFIDREVFTSQAVEEGWSGHEKGKPNLLRDYDLGIQGWVGWGCQTERSPPQANRPEMYTSLLHFCPTSQVLGLQESTTTPGGSFSNIHFVLVFCLVPKEVRRGLKIPLNWSYGWLSHHVGAGN